LTRFDARSDLSRLNGAAGSWVEVDSRLLAALVAALRARRDTSGRFDPTILPALMAAGYDRTFDELEPRPARSVGGWRAGAAVFVDQDGGRARVAADAAVDLGGIGTGFSAERALDAMRLAWPGLSGGFVDLGGDIAFFGAPAGGSAWRVAVADPRAPGETLAMLGIRGAGVATSGRDRRRFGPGGVLHHLIDPVTGAPAEVGPLAVTVVAPDATEAEAHATALAISTREDARAHVERHPATSALYVPQAGPPVQLGALPVVPQMWFEVAA
jgi:thiamine biosynthesis lipoprotein